MSFEFGFLGKSHIALVKCLRVIKLVFGRRRLTREKKNPKKSMCGIHVGRRRSLELIHSAVSFILFYFGLVADVCESREIVSFSRQYKIFISTHFLVCLLNSSGSHKTSHSSNGWCVLEFSVEKIRQKKNKNAALTTGSYDDDDLQLFLLIFMR